MPTTESERLSHLPVLVSPDSSTTTNNRKQINACVSHHVVIIDKIILNHVKFRHSLLDLMPQNDPKFFASSKPHVLVLVSILLLLRGRVITGPTDLLRNLSQVRFSKDLSPSELTEALQQLYVEEPDGTKQLLVPFRNSISKVRLNRE